MPLSRVVQQRPEKQLEIIEGKLTALKTKYTESYKQGLQQEPKKSGRLKQDWSRAQKLPYREQYLNALKEFAKDCTQQSGLTLDALQAVNKDVTAVEQKVMASNIEQNRQKVTQLRKQDRGPKLQLPLPSQKSHKPPKIGSSK
jgi:hypothetical protein